MTEESEEESLCILLVGKGQMGGDLEDTMEPLSSLPFLTFPLPTFVSTFFVPSPPFPYLGTNFLEKLIDKKVWSKAGYW